MNLSVMERDIDMQTTITQNKFAYSVDEISRETTLSKAFLRNKIREGELEATRFGRRVLVLAENLEKFLKNGSK